jgi:hypothetical protein
MHSNPNQRLYCTEEANILYTISWRERKVQQSMQGTELFSALWLVAVLRTGDEAPTT